MWQFDEIYNLAVSKLDKLSIPPVDKAILAAEYNVGRGWLMQAYAALGAREKPLTVSEARRIGMETVTLLAEVRERIRTRKHREEVEILSAGGLSRLASPTMTRTVSLGGNYFGGFGEPARAQSPVTAFPSKHESPAVSPRPVETPLPLVPKELEILPAISTLSPEYTKEDLEDVKAVFDISD